MFRNARRDPPGGAVEEGEELLLAVTLGHLVGDLFGGDIEDRHPSSHDMWASHRCKPSTPGGRARLGMPIMYYTAYVPVRSG